MEDRVRLSRLIFQHGKLKVLEELLDNPEKEYSIKQLSEESGASYDLTHRFVGKLAELGIVSRRRMGGSVIINLNGNSPYVEKLRELVRIDFQPLIERAEGYAEKIGGKGGVEAVVLFGSVARGAPKVGSDIDILILVVDNEEEVESYANRIASKYEREEQITFVPVVEDLEDFREDLESGSPFAEEIKEEGVRLKGEVPW